MSRFMVRWQFAGVSAKALVEKSHDRTAEARVLMEGFGSKLLSYYFPFGECDGVAISDATSSVLRRHNAHLSKT